jgi:hypothetical protein
VFRSCVNRSPEHEFKVHKKYYTWLLLCQSKVEKKPALRRFRFPNSGAGSRTGTTGLDSVARSRFLLPNHFRLVLLKQKQIIWLKESDINLFYNRNRKAKVKIKKIFFALLSIKKKQRKTFSFVESRKKTWRFNKKSFLISFIRNGKRFSINWKRKKPQIQWKQHNKIPSGQTSTKSLIQIPIQYFLFSLCGPININQMMASYYAAFTIVWCSWINWKLTNLYTKHLQILEWGHINTNKISFTSAKICREPFFSFCFRFHFLLLFVNFSYFAFLSRHFQKHDFQLISFLL